MQQQGLMLDVIAYHALSSACEKAQDAKRAFQTFHAMQQQGLKLAVIACNTLSSACGKAQDEKRAKLTGPCSRSASCLTSLPTTPCTAPARRPRMKSVPNLPGHVAAAPHV